MNRNSPRKDWFFPIDEAPVLATVTRNGVSRDVRVPHKKALVAADTGEISPGNTMTDLASHPPQSPRFRRDLPTLERRAGAWLRDFHSAVSRPGFTVPGHLAALLSPPRPAPDRQRASP
jgi:hypothetical protein